MNLLFLDDDVIRTKRFKSIIPSAQTALTAEECINKLKTEEEWDIVFLDHDLGNEIFVDSKRPDTGMEVVRWICENEPFVRQIIVHSLNFPGAKNMVDTLTEMRYNTIHTPFYILIENLAKFYNHSRQKE